MFDVQGEAVFLDVGQGTANLVRLVDGRALVIDAGPGRANSLHRYLADHPPRRIECVVLSHNHDDHIAGWEELAQRYGHKMEDVWVLQDQELGSGNAYDRSMELYEERVIPKPRRLEVDRLRKPKTIWHDDKLGMQLDLLYPDMHANYSGRHAGDPNRTCGIARLSCCGESILYPGDSPIEAWEDLYEVAGEKGFDETALAVPHHGGLLGKKTSSATLGWLFEEAVRSKIAVISVGTNNRYKHPRKKLIEALAASGAEIMCTEVTRECHKRGLLEELGGRVLEPRPGSSPEWRAKGAVACAGTVTALLGPNGVRVERMDEHNDAINEKLTTPMCLK